MRYSAIQVKKSKSIILTTVRRLSYAWKAFSRYNRMKNWYAMNTYYVLSVTGTEIDYELTCIVTRIVAEITNQER